MGTNYSLMLEESFTGMEGMVIAIQILPLILIAILLIQRIVFGLLCKKLANKKGYTGYFFTGFFLGMLGFIYVIFLPDMKLRKYVRGCAVRLQMMDNRVEQLEESQRR